MRTPRCLLIPQLVIALAVTTGCDGTGPDNPVAQYNFTLQAWGQDSIAGHPREHYCLLNGLFEVPRPLAAHGAVTFSVRVERRVVEVMGTHYEDTRADTSIAEAQLIYTGLGQSTMDAVLRAGPYSVSLAAGERDGGAYIGSWTCGSDVPLAQDSTLVAYGYDADLLAPGSWEVFELQGFR